MAASPVALSSASISNRSYSRRPPLVLTQRRLEANRRNAARSTGPRTRNGKARVACNAIKHGFFAGPERWTEQQRRDFAETFEGLCDDFKPQTELEEICVATIADSYVRMAAMLRYENIAALNYHQQREREIEQCIAAAPPAEAAGLEAHREELRRAGLWRPTIPGPREAATIVRYEGRLHRAIRDATADLHALRARSAVSSLRKAQKQTHFIQQNWGISIHLGTATGGPEERGETSSSSVGSLTRRTSDANGNVIQSVKTNPLNPMFMGNRHERRRAKALSTYRRR